MLGELKNSAEKLEGGDLDELYVIRAVMLVYNVQLVHQVQYLSCRDTETHFTFLCIVHRCLTDRIY